jgi:hypothetical protein
MACRRAGVTPVGRTQAGLGRVGIVTADPGLPEIGKARPVGSYGG